jgi:hypothetical protein
MNYSLLIQLVEFDPAICGKLYIDLLPGDPVTKNPCSAARLDPRAVVPIGIGTGLVI